MAKKSYKFISSFFKHNLFLIKTLLKLNKIDLQESIKLLTTAVKYAKTQGKSSNKEDSQNASYIDYDMEYINALSEATIYELEL